MITKPEIDNCILTFGYGNRPNYDVFFAYFEQFNVAHLIDVRLRPRAWSALWYAPAIEKACNSKNVKYLSHQSLGNTSGKSNWIPPDRNKATDALLEVANLTKTGTVMLLCAELDPAKCHRVDVANELQKFTSLPVQHLR